jgi:putative MFS transporter
MDLVIYGYIFSFFSDGGLSAIAPYTPELYPTRARATGVGWATGAGRIASILAPLAVGMLVPSGLSTVFLVLASGYLLAAIAVIIFRVETKKLLLEDASMET